MGEATEMFLFTGQGAQYVGMGAELADERPDIQAMMDRADEVLGTPLGQIMRHGPEETLRMTENTQPAILFVYKVGQRTLN